MTLQLAGAGCFGFVIGWICYRTLRLTGGAAAISDIATVIGAVGGGVLTIFKSGDLFGAYSIGLAAGFVSYFLIGLKLYGSGWWKGSYFVAPPQ